MDIYDMHLHVNFCSLNPCILKQFGNKKVSPPSLSLFLSLAISLSFSLSLFVYVPMCAYDRVCVHNCQCPI